VPRTAARAGSVARALMAVSAAALVVAAASAGPSAIAASTASRPVVGGAVGVTFVAEAPTPRASRNEIRMPITEAFRTPAALAHAALDPTPLSPFAVSFPGGVVSFPGGVAPAAHRLRPATVTSAVPVAAGPAATTPSGKSTKQATSDKAVPEPALWARPNGGPLSSPFGRRWGRLHAGIDLAGSYGSPILAATSGTVYFTGPEEGYGRIIKIQDSDGTQTWYAHMSRYLVNPGDHVRAGERIAFVGVAGDATGPNLHFEVHVGGLPVDPVPFLRKHGVDI
jgi:murein DD-endopeptidase MepM/ murein hydrolase activator NlpD